MPGLKDFELLFESSTGLQNALACYYAVVIDICRQAVLALQRSTIKQLAHSAFKSFTSEYSSLQTDLQRNLTKIHEQISLASKQIIVDESRKNELERVESSSFRSSWAKRNAKAAQTLEDLHRMQLQSQRRHLRQDRETVRSRLSTIDPNTSWQRIKRKCIPGTASWFEDSQDFIGWRTSHTSSVLIHSARMGCGKTTVFSNIIDSLVISEGSNAMISFFFMEGENAASLKPRNIIGSILKQLLEPAIQSADHNTLEELLTKSALQDSLALASALEPYIAKSRPAFILLDGIDEVEASDRWSLCDALRGLCRSLESTTTSRVLVTRRPNVETSGSVIHADWRMSAKDLDIEQDMALFIDSSIQAKLNPGLLPMGQEEEVVSLIQFMVARSAGGMFLFAKLLIEHLCRIDNFGELLETLNKSVVPDRLADLYDRILNRLAENAQKRDRLHNLLVWTAGALRPLSGKELREALTIKSGQTSLDVKALPDIQTAIASAGGLVDYDSDQDTVHLIHLSLAQHLLGASGNAQWFTVFGPFNRQFVDHTIFEACYVYLHFNEFKRTMTKSVRITPERLVAEQLPQSMRGTAGRLGAITARSRQRLTSFRQLPAKDLGKHYDDMHRRLLALASDASASVSSHLINYAGAHWIHHGADLKPDHNLELCAKFRHLADSSEPHIKKL